MIMPNNIDPKYSLYFVGGIILKTIKKEKIKFVTVDELYMNISKEYKVSYQLVILSLDWLFMINAIQFREGGIICL